MDGQSVAASAAETTQDAIGVAGQNGKPKVEVITDRQAGSYPGSTATARACALSQASETRSIGAHTHGHTRHAHHTHVRTAEV